MPRHQNARVPYAGYESLSEPLMPDEPTESELELQRLEFENQHLRQENAHLRSALATAGRVLQPYFRRLNGSQE